MAAVTKKAIPPVEVAGINFGDPEMYSGGGGIPPGKYALEFTVQMFQGQDKQGVSKFAARLGVMVKAHSLTDPDHTGDKAYTQFYSMGTDAHKSFAPNAETGKGLVVVPGGGAVTLPRLTNWNVFLDQMYNAGLPQGVFSNDISALDGLHAVLAHIDEPDERKSFTGGAMGASAEPKGKKTIAVVSEILDDGKPWEGTGGIPDGTAASAKVNGKAPAGPVAVKKTASAPAQAQTDEADVLTAAQSAATTVISGNDPQTKKSNAGGMLHLKFRTGTFSAVKKTYGDDMAQAVADQFFGSADATNVLLNALGYETDGVNVTPVS